jgi:hypothetical protein
MIAAAACTGGYDQLGEQLVSAHGPAHMCLLQQDRQQHQQSTCMFYRHKVAPDTSHHAVVANDKWLLSSSMQLNISLFAFNLLVPAYPLVRLLPFCFYGS